MAVRGALLSNGTAMASKQHQGVSSDSVRILRSAIRWLLAPERHFTLYGNAGRPPGTDVCTERRGHVLHFERGRECLPVGVGRPVDLLVAKLGSTNYYDDHLELRESEIEIHTIDDWLERIGSDTFPHLPDEIKIFSADFSIATQRANGIDHIVAENMGAALLYAGEAETNLNVLRARNPSQPGWQDIQGKAAKNLNNARYKLNVARTRWDSMSSSPAAG